MLNVVTGYLRGTGAAINVSIGFIPDLVIVKNETDGDIWTVALPGGGRQVMPFSSGGTNAIAAGDRIKGATSGAKAMVIGVILDSGSWAGGDAAGWILLDLPTKTGTFQSENIVHCDALGGTLNSETDNATVTVDLVPNQKVDTAVATTTTTSTITSYQGTTLLAPGFTVGSVVSEDAKLLSYVAITGSGTPLIGNSL